MTFVNVGPSVFLSDILVQTVKYEQLLDGLSQHLVLSGSPEDESD